MFDGDEQMIYHSSGITQQLDNCFQVNINFMHDETDILVLYCIFVLLVEQLLSERNKITYLQFLF